MKRLLLFLLVYVSIASSQFVQRIDSVTTLPESAATFDKVVYHDSIFVYANGGWHAIHAGFYGILNRDSVSTVPPGSPDSTIWAKKYLLDGKQNAGTYLVPSDTNDLRSSIDGKQTAGTYLVPSDTNSFAARLAGKQPVGTYLVPSDSTLLSNQIAGKEPTITAGTTGQYWRGDKTWQTLPGGSDPWTRIIRSSDTTKGNGTAFVNLGQLEFVMDAGGFYAVEAEIYVVRATAANGWTLAMNFSQAPSNTAIWGIGHNAAATQTINLIDTYLDSLAMTGTTVTTGDAPVRLYGWVLNTGSATSFRMRFHGELATNVTIKRGSELRYRRLY